MLTVSSCSSLESAQTLDFLGIGMPGFRLGVSTSTNLICIILHRHTQRLVSLEGDSKLCHVGLRLSTTSTIHHHWLIGCFSSCFLTLNLFLEIKFHIMGFLQCKLFSCWRACSLLSYYQAAMFTFLPDTLGKAARSTEDHVNLNWYLQPATHFPNIVYIGNFQIYLRK